MRAQLEDLLAEFWSLREDGEAVTVEQFLARYPEREAELRKALTAMLATSQMLPEAGLPTSIAGYQVDRRLGQGATGEVFAVKDANERALALKRLLPHAAMTLRAQQRLWREADVLRELNHPNIVDVVEIGEDEASKVPFLVMELIDGTTLSAWIAEAKEHGLEHAGNKLRGPGDAWQRIARCAAAISDAVETAHKAGVLHRDLKPGNVLLRPDGAPVVIDFGLAADEAAATLTGTGDLLGTPNYMAPEQARGAPASATSDVYGIAAVLFNLLTLCPPRTGTDAVQVLELARHRQPPTPRDVVPAVPRALDLITRRAMAFREGHRYQSAGELARALETVAAGGQPVDLTLGLPQRVDDFWRQHSRAVIAVAATTVVAALAWFVIGLRNEARVETLRTAMVTAFECHLDGDADGLTSAATILVDSDELALVRWLQGEATHDNTFVVELSSGHKLLLKQPNVAVTHLQNAVALRPDLAIASGWLGIAALQADDKVLAERELTAAVRTLPNSLRLRLELGRMLRRARRGADAVVHLEHAVSLPRATSSTWHELSKARMVNKQYELAVVAVDQALGQTENARRQVAILRTKGIIFDAMKRHEEALPIMEKIVALKPTASSRMSYGMVLDKLHRIRDAKDVYQGVLKDYPNNEHALLNLAFLFAGADAKCAQCRAYFVKNTDLYDPAKVDEYATRLIRVQTGRFALAELTASYLKRTGGGEQFVAAIDEFLSQDHSAEALGRLLRAKRIVLDK